MVDKNSKSSKQVIMEAAIELFAEKGFDGARVDEIAKRAQVNKALIYYYFESKDKILEELMSVLIKDMIDLKDQLTININVLEPMNDSKVDDFIYQAYKFFKKRKLLLNIILSEALKGATNKNIFFEMLSLNIADGVGRIKQMNGEITDFEEFNIIAIFFNFIPLLNFISFGEKWAEYNHMDYSFLESKFYQTFKLIYKDYFLKTVFPKE
ncbi:MAG: helix-turn-helix domain-containing protein [Syntrophomonas sp.]